MQVRQFDDCHGNEGSHVVSRHRRARQLPDGRRYGGGASRHRTHVKRLLEQRVALAAEFTMARYWTLRHKSGAIQTVMA